MSAMRKQAGCATESIRPEDRRWPLTLPGPGSQRGRPTVAKIARPAGGPVGIIASVGPPDVHRLQVVASERLRQLAPVVRLVRQQPLQDRCSRVELALIPKPALE